MQFEYYSIGDSEFLYQILNGVAMLTGNGDIKMVVMIGMVFGVLIIGIQAVENTSHIDWFKAIVGWVMYMVIFGTTATVVIHNVYNGTTKFVDNVPVGVAVLGNWTSAIGMTVTEDFEQAFTLTQTSDEMKMTKGGFAAGLKHLIDMRYISLYGNSDNLGVKGASVQKTIHNYLQYCTLPGIDTGLIDEDTFLHSKTPINDMKFDNNVYTTSVFLPQYAPVPPEGTILGCGDAHQQLMKVVNGSQFILALNLFAASKMGISDQIIAQNALGYLQSDLDSLTGIGNNARDYMMAAVIKNALAGAEEDKRLSEGDLGSALIIAQAEQQLNVQNAASGTLFMRFVHPLMTFMEGFVFAITPFMAMLIATGSLGIRMAGKYLLMLVWIQLWMPILSITNLYLNMAILQKMSVMTDIDQLSPVSILGMVHAHVEIANWLGTAGMLAAATPAFAMMLLYGGSIAATHLAGRLAATDTIDEKVAAPDVLHNGASLEMQPGSVHTTAGGTAFSGASQVDKVISWGEEQSHSVASAKTGLKSAQHSLTDVATQRVTSSDGSGTTYQVGNTIRTNAVSANGKTTSFVDGISASVSSGVGLNDEQSESLITKIGAGISAGKSVKEAVDGAITSMKGSVDATKISQLFDNAEKLGSNEQLQAGLNDSIAKDTLSGKLETAEHRLGKDKVNEFGERSQALSAAEKRYTKANQRTQTFGSKTSAHESVMGGRNSSAQLQNIVERAKSFHDDNGKQLINQQMIQAKAHRIDHAIGIGMERAQAVAAMELEKDMGKATDREDLTDVALDSAATLVGRGSPGYDMQSPDQNKGVGDGAGAPLPMNDIPEPDGSKIKNKVNADLASADDRIAQHHTDGKEAVYAEEAVKRDQARQVSSDKIIGNLKTKLDAPSTVATVAEGAGVVASSIKAVGKLGKGGVEGVVVGAAAFAKTLFHDHGTMADATDAFLQAGSGQINKYKNELVDGLKEQGHNRGLSEAQNKLFSDMAMNPVAATEGEWGMLPQEDQDRLNADKEAVQKEIYQHFTTTDKNGQHHFDAGRAAAADYTITENIFKAAKTGDFTGLNMIGGWNRNVGLTGIGS